MLSNQSYVDSKYNDIKNNQITFFVKTISLDISHYFNGDGMYYDQYFTIMENGYMPYIYTVSSLTTSGTFTLQSNGSFETLGHTVYLQYNNTYMETPNTAGQLNVPVSISQTINANLLFVLTRGTTETLVHDSGTSYMVLVNSTNINNLRLRSIINMRGSGSSHPTGTISGTASIVVSGIAVKPV